jgi:signal transduction histidine kinase
MAVHLALAIESAERYAAELDARAAAELSQQAAHAALANAEAALKTRNEFLNVAAHELKTPVTSLLGAAQLVTRRLDVGAPLDPERLRRALDMVQRQARRVAHLTDSLLDISRIQAGKLRLDRQDADVVALARAVVAQADAKLEGFVHSHPDVADSARCRLRLDAPAEPVVARVDASRLEQVLTNLVDNALRYSPNGGEITVSVTRGSGSGSDVVQLAVRDHGLGIPEDKRAGIFERYYQAHSDTHTSGLGLGLYICHQIVQLHGGAIHAEFPPDGGTRMAVTLPLDRSHAG